MNSAERQECMGDTREYGMGSGPEKDRENAIEETQKKDFVISAWAASGIKKASRREAGWGLQINPRSAIETISEPTTKWSSTRTSIKSKAVLKRFVILMSDRLGVGSPLGWQWANTAAAAFW